MPSHLIGQRLSLNTHSPVPYPYLGGDLFPSIVSYCCGWIYPSEPTHSFIPLLSLIFDAFISSQSLLSPLSYCQCSFVQFAVATIICNIPASFLFLVSGIFSTTLRLTPLLMAQYIEVDDQESVRNDDEPLDEDIPTTSSELEHHSGSEESK